MPAFQGGVVFSITELQWGKSFGSASTILAWSESLEIYLAGGVPVSLIG